MEINISALHNVDLSPFCGNQAIHGTNAASVTWSASLEYAANSNFLDSTEKLEGLRDHLKDMGMDETESMDKTALEALLIQLVANELWENGLEFSDLNEDEPGLVGVRVFFGNDGEYYYLLG
jgi:hypothetical protein